MKKGSKEANEARKQGSKEARKQGSKEANRFRQKFWAEFSCISVALQAFWLVLAGPTIYTKSGGLADTVSGHTGRQFRKTVLERES